MKTTDKNEIDLLLRALGRDASVRSAGASSQEIGAHLDADELNCYAEGVVSSAERARYNKHLADCESCRRIVVALVPAASVSRGYEAVERKTGWHWRDRLSALFAPSVLRYAVPALALTAIIAIAIVALRQRQDTEFLAQNQTPTLPAVSTGDEGQRSITNNGPQSSASPGKQQQPVAELKEKSLSQPQKSDVTQPPVAPAKAASGD
ncbi:MAG TPA: zf-HC2 domain-containing protein, partial [Pyrinomonadaceae bacterium]